MQINQLIKETKTGKMFKNNCDLPLDQINQAIGNSFYAPNHKMTKPWKVFLTQPGSMREDFMNYATQDMQEKGESLRKKWVETPYLILFCAKENADPIIAKENYASVCCAVQLLALQLRDVGCGYKWATPSGFYKVDFAKYFNDAEKYQFVGMIVAGNEEAESAAKPRPDRGNLKDYFWMK